MTSARPLRRSRRSHRRLQTACIALLAAVLPARAQASIPLPDHVVVVMEENKSYKSVIGAKAAPYINSLAAGGASFGSFFSITHPSQPNYLALFSGSTHGVTGANCSAEP